MRQHHSKLWAFNNNDKIAFISTISAMSLQIMTSQMNFLKFKNQQLKYIFKDKKENMTFSRSQSFKWNDIITQNFATRIWTYLGSTQRILPEKAMAPNSSTLAWKIPWTEEPGRLQSMVSLRVRHMTERLHFHFSLSCIGEGNGTPLQCSCLENPREGGAWLAAVYGVAQSQT